MVDPTLDLSANPLLEGLAPYTPLSAMPRALLRQPLESINWRSYAPEMREQLLSLQEQHFFPTEASIEIASSLQNAIRGSLNRRNPLSQAEQRRINMLLRMQADSEIELLPSLANPATGGVLAAETGIGKTTIVRRALEVIAPEQFVRHSRSDACGWSTLTQIFYLHLDFPSNGTRGGLVARFLHGVDSLLGTDYLSCNRRLRNLEASLLLAMKVLSMHRVGVLALDEMQPDNFDACHWRREFVLFFLCLLNLGIPLLLCGHPKAFKTLGREGQVVRRFSDIGYYRLARATSVDEPWWGKVLIPGVMGFNLCESAPGAAAILQASQSTTAGIPATFVQCWIEAQRIALRRGGSQAALTYADFESATATPRTVELIRMARWLQGYSPDDVGYSDLTAPACKPSSDNIAAAPRVPPGMSQAAFSSTQQASIVKKIRKQEKLDQTRAVARDKKNRLLLEKLEPEDLRKVARATDLLAGLDEQQSELFNASGSTPKHDD